MADSAAKPASEAVSGAVCAACGVAIDGKLDACPACGGIPETPAAMVLSPEVVNLGHPLREILRVAAPSVATMTSYTAMQFVDAMMVARIDPSDQVYLSAQGNGGLAAWIPMSVCAGMVGVVNTYVAQHLGAGKPEKGAAYGWNGLWVSVLAAVLLVPYLLVLPWVFRHFEHGARLIDLEMSYTRVLIGGAVFSMGTRAIAQYFYGMHRPAMVFVAALTGNIVNFGFNYALVFGHFGFPALGITGSAAATVIGSAVELSIPMAVFLSPKWNRLYGTRAAWRPSLSHLKEIWKIGWPGALTFGNEMICWGYFVIGLVAPFGEANNTATWIAHRYMHLSFMPAVGISFAMTAVVGKCLGMGRPDLAQQRARLGIAISMTYMGLCALAFLVLRGPMAEVFSSDPAVLGIASNLILIAAVFQLFDGMGITIIGVLRGAGDTVWPGVVTVVLSWSFLVGGGTVVARLRPEWGALGPWAGASSYIIVLGLVLLYRFARGAWKGKKLVREPGVGGE